MPVRSSTLRISDDPYLGYEPIRDFHDASVQHNRHGMRSPEVSEDKGEDVYRIACIGDSITYGWELGQGEDFPARLQAQILSNNPSRRVEVLNFGVPAYNISQVRRLLQTRVMAFDPDLILYGFCLNDTQSYNLVTEALLAQLPAGQRAALRTKGGEFAKEQRSWLESSRLFVLAKTYLEERQLPRMAAKNAFQEASKKDPQLAQASKARYFYELYAQPKARKLLATELGAMKLAAGNTPIFLIPFPLLHDLEEYPLASVSEVIGEITTDSQIERLDPLAAFVKFEADQEPPLRHDFLHLSAAGNVCCARFLLDELSSRNLIPK